MRPLPLPPTIKGWCPTALHPMETGDGFLIRLHFTGGKVTAEQCASLGKLAGTYGNGLIDLSQRGNLQLRGISAKTIPVVTSALFDEGLLNEQARSDAVHDVIVSPLASLGLNASIDGFSLVRDLEARLATRADLAGLPSKFCFLIDDGGKFGLDAVAADIRLIGVDGQVMLAVTDANSSRIPLTIVPIACAVTAALDLARAFLKLCDATAARRMPQLVEAVGVAKIAEAAGFTYDPSLSSGPARITQASDVIGARDGFIGVGAPFGRLNADQIDLLATLAPDSIHLTPWRCLLLRDVDASVLEPLEHAGFIVSPDDPRLNIVACPGSPACASAQIDTRHAAEAFAPVVRAWAQTGIGLHISGCSKGCAYNLPASIMLVGHEGAFDLILNGRADDVPVLRGLTLSEALDATRRQEKLS